MMRVRLLSFRASGPDREGNLFWHFRSVVELSPVCLRVVVRSGERKGQQMVGGSGTGTIHAAGFGNLVYRNRNAALLDGLGSNFPLREMSKRAYCIRK
jgi:hypothetical protein